METNQSNIPTPEEAVGILNSRKVVSNPGAYFGKVTNVTPHVRDDEKRTQVAIINLNLMNDYQVEEAVKLIQSGNIQEGLNKKLSGSARIGKDFIPQKGEIVKVFVDYVPTKENRKVKALLVTNVTAVPVQEGRTLDFASILEIEAPTEKSLDKDTVSEFLEEKESHIN